MPWLADFRALAVAEARDIVREAVSPLGPYLRRLSLGSAFVLLAALGFGAGIIFLLVACYLALTAATTPVAAALWTALVAILSGLVLLVTGLRNLRKPHA